MIINNNKLFLYLLSFAALFALWQILSLLIGSEVLPSPIPVVLAFFVELTKSDFWQNTYSSLFRILGGLGLAFITAVPFGLLLGSSPKLDKWFSPIIYISYPIPKIILLPVILLLFGLGNLSKIILIAIIVFFQLLITTRDSARLIDNNIKYSFKSLGGSKIQYFNHVVWPATLPGVYTSLRIGTGTAVAVLFFVESISARSGLGMYIIDAWGRADYISMFVGMLALSLIGIMLYELFDLLEKISCKWKSII
ncbi:MAG: ABC transporter permease subunit [Planctomycetia bacterium]|nr:ABC transporter permease subunit [Planctomycetia bacterium]